MRIGARVVVRPPPLPERGRWPARVGVATATGIPDALGVGRAAKALLVLFNDVERGALPLLCAATEDVPGNAYVGPDGVARLRELAHELVLAFRVSAS